MSKTADNPFLTFLEAGVAKGGFETDDVLAALLPLLKQVQAAHQAGLVAPLNGIHDLILSEQGHLMFAAAKVGSPQRNIAKIEALTPMVPIDAASMVTAELSSSSSVDTSGTPASDSS